MQAGITQYLKIKCKAKNFKDLQKTDCLRVTTKLTENSTEIKKTEEKCCILRMNYK
jgi:hypothetical protein